MDDLVFEITVVGSKTGRTSAESEHGIFNYGCTDSHTFKEMPEMFQVRIKIIRRPEYGIRFRLFFLICSGLFFIICLH